MNCRYNRKSAHCNELNNASATCMIDSNGCDFFEAEQSHQNTRAEESSLERIVSLGMHPDLEAWEKLHGSPLLIGREVKIKSSWEHYEEEHDEYGVYMVTMMFVDSGGLCLGINDGTPGNYGCEVDGLYIADIEPAVKG